MKCINFPRLVNSLCFTNKASYHTFTQPQTHTPYRTTTIQLLLRLLRSRIRIIRGGRCRTNNLNIRKCIVAAASTSTITSSSSVVISHDHLYYWLLCNKMCRQASQATVSCCLEMIDASKAFACLIKLSCVSELSVVLIGSRLTYVYPN